MGILFSIHILAGLVGLVSAALALSTEKGKKFHVLIGKAYFWSMVIIFLTALEAISEKVAGLDLGADDYLSKPFSPKELEEEIKKYFQDFKVIYKPDHRDELAKSWPQSISDTHARNDWGWEPNFNLSQMVSDIILNLTNRYKKEPI